MLGPRTSRAVCRRRLQPSVSPAVTLTSRLRLNLLRLTASLAALLPALAPAPASAAFDEGSWSITPAFASQYLFRGARLAGASFQPSIDYTAGPLALGLWSNAALSDQISGDSDPEFDFYGTYLFSNDAGTLDFIPGFWLYTHPDAQRSRGYHSLTFEPNLAVNFYVRGIRLTPQVYYDIMLKGATWELNAGFAVPLKTLGTTLEFLATAGTFKRTNVTAGASPREKSWGRLLHRRRTPAHDHRRPLSNRSRRHSLDRPQPLLQARHRAEIR